MTWVKTKLEKEIEKKFCSQIHPSDGLCLKLIPMSYAGFPDRTVLLKGGKIFFIEFKAPGKKPRKLQTYVHGILEALGFTVAVIDSEEGAIQYAKLITR